MRKLEGDDLFKVSEILDKMNFSLDTLMEGEKPKTQNEAGLAIISFIIRKLHLAKNELQALLADLTGKSIDEVKKQSPKELIAQIKELASQEGMSDFFK